MERTYHYEHGTVRVIFPEECDREELKKITANFIKESIRWREINGNGNTSKDFGKK